MLHKLTPTESLYVRSMGKAFQVVAITDTDEEANDFMRKNDGAAVMAVFGPLIFLADRYDKGTQIPKA